MLWSVFTAAGATASAFSLPDRRPSSSGSSRAWQRATMGLFHCVHSLQQLLARRPQPLLSCCQSKLD